MYSFTVMNLSSFGLDVKKMQSGLIFDVMQI